MSDAYCGPSNALQNFKNHSSVDRTLQQDRLVSRQQPGQGFRSHDPNAGILDPEFEAFQAGQPTAFSGPAFPTHDQFQPFHPSQNVQNAGPSHAGPSQAPAWASDFQNMHISSPPPLQQQMHSTQNAAWASQFQQSSGKSPMHSGFASPGPAMQYNASPAFGMNRGLMGGFPQQSRFQQPVQETQTMQAQKQDFDEAAFQAAFDAAMEDAFQSQEQEAMSEKAEESGRIDKVDIYPHLPLIRLALLKAILDGRDFLLHDAAMFVQQLGRHDPKNMDPIQAMLLRPLISRLADQSRSPFAQRYQMTEYLRNLNEKFQEVEKGVQISPENEQLLAAYADCLWARHGTDHPQNLTLGTTDDSYWRVSLEEHMENWSALDPTDQAMRMLSETNLFGLETPESMQRVLDLEGKAYQSRLSSQGLETKLPGSENPEGLLYRMASILRDSTDVQQELDRVRHAQHDSASALPSALQDYQAQLATLEARAKQGVQIDPLAKQVLHQGLNQTSQVELQNMALRQEIAEAERAHLNVTEAVGEPLQHVPEQPLQEEIQQQDQPTKDDDELAQTAADLLNKVSHDTSSKFKNSAFLGLMRKLADREVKVQGDKVVETNYSTATTDQKQAAPSTWSQSGPMQAPSSQVPQSSQPAAPQPETTLPKDGQEVIDILNSPSVNYDQDYHEYEEGYLLPTGPMTSSLESYADRDAHLSAGIFSS